MKKVRFTVVLSDEENDRLKALTYAHRFGSNRSAFIRALINKAWEEYKDKDER